MIIIIIIILLFIKYVNSWNKNNCNSFNKGLDIYINKTNNNILNYYQCPDYDGLDSNACLNPMKTTTNNNSISSNITYSDIVFVILIGGSKGRDKELVRHYWLDMIPKNISLDIVLIYLYSD